MAFRWFGVALASELAWLACVPVHAQQARGGGARQLDAPVPPGGVESPAAAPAPEPAPATRSVPLQSPPDPHPRRGMAGIIVGWSGFGASVASLAMMATCRPLFGRAQAALDSEQLDEVEMEVEDAVHDGARICRAIYGAFAGAAGSLAVLGLPIGYARRHRYYKRLERGQAAVPRMQLALQPRFLRRGGGLFLYGRFR